MATKFSAPDGVLPLRTIAESSKLRELFACGIPLQFGSRRESCDFADVAAVQAVANLVVLKNIPLRGEGYADIAEAALGGTGLSRMEPMGSLDDLALRTRAINNFLDLIAVFTVREFVTLIEGKERATNAIVNPIVTCIVQGIVDNAADKQCIRWPHLFESVRAYYAAVPYGPVVEHLADGAVVTTYWLGGKLHRDPKERPAWHRKDANGERTEYVVNGQLHRDHADGPAVIDSNFEGRGILSEEYFEHGMPHRPSSEGPATLHTDRNGRHILEIYGEHGQMHREEQDGPARSIFDNETGTLCLEEFYYCGDLHRLHGPASSARNPNGSVNVEAWYRNGNYHRDPAEGPAVVLWNEDGTVAAEEFWKDGELIESTSTECQKDAS